MTTVVSFWSLSCLCSASSGEASWPQPICLLCPHVPLSLHFTLPSPIPHKKEVKLRGTIPPSSCSNPRVPLSLSPCTPAPAPPGAPLYAVCGSWILSTHGLFASQKSFRDCWCLEQISLSFSWVWSGAHLANYLDHVGRLQVGRKAASSGIGDR